MLVVVLLASVVVGIIAYNMGHDTGWEKGRQVGVKEGEERMLEWVRSQGMKRRRPRVKVLTIDDD